MKATKLILIAAVIIAAIILIGSYAKGGQAAYIEREIRVESGDTLWELGGRYAPLANREEWIHKVCELNGIDASLDVGQALIIYEEVTN